jgi:hypothetical protein
MSTPLHATEALRALADGPAGPARDWSRVHLAARGVDAGLPDDPASLRTALAAGAAPEPLLARLAGAGRSELAVLAQGLDEVARMGALPAEGAAWIGPLTGAVRGRGWSSDVAAARLLAELGHHDDAVLAAAARVADDPRTALLPRVVLGFAAARGADVDGIASELAARLAPRLGADGELLGAALAALGVPRVKPGTAIPDLETALVLGGGMAGVDETPPVSPGRGAQRRRMQQAGAELLSGVPGPAPALVRALLRHDAADAGVLLVAATWLRCAPPAAPEDAVVDHAAGEDPAVLAAAARGGAPDAAALSLALAVDHQLDPPAAVLAARALAAGRRGTAVLAESLADRAATALGEARLQAALAVSLARDPSPVLRWLETAGLRTLGLYHARHTAHEEVLAVLLGWRRPETPGERALLGAALAAQGDAAAVTALARLRDDSGDDALDEDLAHARALLGA